MPYAIANIICGIPLTDDVRTVISGFSESDRDRMYGDVRARFRHAVLRRRLGAWLLRR